MSKSIFGIRNSISKKLIATILLISSGVTFVITTMQIAFDFHQDVSYIENNLELVRTTHASSIAKAVWDFDQSNVTIHVESLLNIPGIKRVEIIDTHGERVVSSSNQTMADHHVLNKTIPLQYQNGLDLVDLGHLKITASLDQIYSKIFEKIIIVFLSQFIKTLVVSFFIFLAIQRLLTKNIFHIADYVRRFNFMNPGVELALPRKASPIGQEDEFDLLVKSLNSMRKNLIDSYESLKKLSANLEDRVEEGARVIIEQREKLEYSAKMSALGEMAGGVAHEINNPLAIIKLMAEQVQESLKETPLDKEHVIATATNIVETSERIAKIVLGLRRLGRDGSNEPFVNHSIEPIVADVLSLCQERFRNHGVTLEVSEVPKSSMIRCNPVQLGQVLLNLINNAYDAIEKLPEKWVRIGFELSTDHLTITITDSGRGIPAHLQEKIMQPFFTTKEIGKGTGLGLSISSGIIKSHGGSLSLDQKNANTHFVIRLPIVTHSKATTVAIAA
jgi:signal transduction histidine kinase